MLQNHCNTNMYPNPNRFLVGKNFIFCRKYSIINGYAHAIKSKTFTIESIFMFCTKAFLSKLHKLRQYEQQLDSFSLSYSEKIKLGTKIIQMKNRMEKHHTYLGHIPVISCHSFIHIPFISPYFYILIHILQCFFAQSIRKNFF